MNYAKLQKAFITIRNEQVVGSIPTTSSNNNRGVQMGTSVVILVDRTGIEPERASA